MSIRIYNDGLAGTSASQSERTQGTAAGSGSAAKNDRAATTSGGDHVTISSLSEKIAAASRTDEVQQADRVSTLTALYRSGQYRVDSVQLSRTLVSQALDTGAQGVGH